MIPDPHAWIKNGATVGVAPVGELTRPEPGKIEIISGNRCSLAVIFPDKPWFLGITSGFLVHPKGAAMLLTRTLDKATFIDLVDGRLYVISQIQPRP